MGEVDNALFKLIEERQRLLESAVVLDETYEALGMIPENPRVLAYSELWNNVYNNVAVHHGEKLDMYAAVVANQTVRRYLNQEWNYVNAMLIEGPKERKKIEVKSDEME